MSSFAEKQRTGEVHPGTGTLSLGDRNVAGDDSIPGEAAPASVAPEAAVGTDKGGCSSAVETAAPLSEPPSQVQGGGAKKTANTVPSVDAECREVLAAVFVDFTAVTRLCRRGLPNWARPTFWKLVVGFYPLKSRSWEAVEDAATARFTDMMQSVCDLDEDNNVISNTDLQRAIDVDVPRTMPTLHFFGADDGNSQSDVSSKRHSGAARGSSCPELSGGEVHHFSHAQQSLRRIMSTLAAVNKGFGYVQGMNELVGHLLYAFAEGKVTGVTARVEAETFFCFQTLLSYLGDDYSQILDDDLESGVLSTVRHFDKVLQFFDLELHEHLSQLGISSANYAMRWLLLLFTQEFNIADSQRVWDFMFSFGDQLRGAALYVAAAMCVYQRTTILAMDSLCDIMPILHHYPACDVNDFLRIAMRWIARFGFGFLENLRVATAEEIDALRLEHGLASQPLLSERLHGWMKAIVGFGGA